MTEYVPAGEFKAKCLKLMDQVNRTKRKIIITKRNKPVAQLLPVEENATTLFGITKGAIHVVGDILSPIDEE